jgi:hypothetical protein
MDYYFQIYIQNSNGGNKVELKPEGWDNLYLEEDIFDWWIKGSIIYLINIITLLDYGGLF